MIKRFFAHVVRVLEWSTRILEFLEVPMNIALGLFFFFFIFVKRIMPEIFTKICEVNEKTKNFEQVLPFFRKATRVLNDSADTLIWLVSEKLLLPICVLGVVLLFLLILSVLDASLKNPRSILSGSGDMVLLGIEVPRQLVKLLALLLYILLLILHSLYNHLVIEPGFVNPFLEYNKIYPLNPIELDEALEIVDLHANLRSKTGLPDNYLFNEKGEFILDPDRVAYLENCRFFINHEARELFFKALDQKYMEEAAEAAKSVSQEKTWWEFFWGKKK